MSRGPGCHALAAFALLCAGVTARLAAAPSTSRERQQLSADGVNISKTEVASESNPEIDAWHDKEKARIEAECNAMMAKLKREKGDKLKTIVDDAVSRVERERRRLTEAEQKVRQELCDVEKEKQELEAARATQTRLSPTREAIAEQEDKLKALAREIGKKKACLDELRIAEESLLCSEKKLAGALKKLDEAEKAHQAQTVRFLNENGDIPPAEEDLASAEEDLARAQARHNIAMQGLDKAETDLAEHDGAGRETSSSHPDGSSGAGGAGNPSDKPPTRPTSAPNSGATPLVARVRVLPLLIFGLALSY